jgi:hypothetical protein
MQYSHSSENCRNTLGVFEADILEERIMRLIERRPRLSKRGRTFIQAAVLSLLAASSVVAAAFSLNIEQGGKEQSSQTALNKKIIGEWSVGLDRGDGYPKGDGAQGPVLIVEANGERLTGKIFPSNLREKEWTLIDPRFEGEKFIIKAEDNDGGVLEGYVKLTDGQFEGPWKHTVRNGEGASGRMKLIRRN